MPRIISRTIAEQLASCQSEGEARELIDTSLQLARDYGYSVPEILRELPDHLHRLIAGEPDGPRRENLLRGLQLVHSMSRPQP